MRMMEGFIGRIVFGMDNRTYVCLYHDTIFNNSIFGSPIYEW